MQTSEDEEMAFYAAFCNDPDARLIAPARGNAPSIVFESDVRARACRIWEGYFDASLILLKKILQTPRSSNLIFPAMFNLRHAIEAGLKWHIQYAGGIVPKRSGHNLTVLIKALRQTAQDLDDEKVISPITQ